MKSLWSSNRGRKVCRQKESGKKKVQSGTRGQESNIYEGGISKGSTVTNRKP